MGVYLYYAVCSAAVRLQKAKNALAVKAEELAKLRQENTDMEDRMYELGETHE